jgi:hypothetical protein
MLDRQAVRARMLSARPDTAVMLLLALATAAGCLRRPVSATGPGAPGHPDAAPITVTALSAYRLVTNRVVIDSPSRLLVIQLRLAADDAATYEFTTDDLVLHLPNGGEARVFDRARAVQLLRRTTLAEADLRYLQQPDHAPGGMSDYVRPQMTDMVEANLLNKGTFDGGTALQGYVVVDTGESFLTLDGGAIEATAHRLGDGATARTAYQFAAVPVTSETR